MSSFSCPHLNTAETFCNRIKTDCVPGRAGCVLKSSKYEFAIPASERINKIRKENSSRLDKMKKKKP